MKSLEDIRNEDRKAQGLQSWKEINVEIHRKLKQDKKRLHPIEWVFIGVMIALCGFLLIGIIEGMQWLLS